MTFYTDNKSHLIQPGNNPYSAPDTHDDTNSGDRLWLRYLPAPILLVVGVLIVSYCLLAIFGIIVSGYGVNRCSWFVIPGVAGALLSYAGIACFRRLYGQTLLAALAAVVIFVVSIYS